ncbi:MAG TPA: DUF1289 domain-containing protein [Spongiibacteraceae bacterium]|nr:DUF1289 domain-containing protein [Spongiibacteraceae bacterium]
MPIPSKPPSLANPCVRQCCLDDDEFCLGCGRHLEEILRWHRVSDSERNEILERAATRRSKLQIVSKSR